MILLAMELSERLIPAALPQIDKRFSRKVAILTGIQSFL
jgi:hypothetical protein